MRQRAPDLADELIAVWDDVSEILRLPDEALRCLADDYRRHRE